MDEKVKDLVRTWNFNAPEVDNGKFFSKSYSDLLIFCEKEYLKKHKTFSEKFFILYIESNKKIIKNQIIKFDEFIQSLHFKYHSKKYNNNSPNRKFIYQGQKNKGEELVLEREIFIKNNEIHLRKYTTKDIDFFIIKKFFLQENIFANYYEFLFYQIDLYNNKSEKLKSWINIATKNNAFKKNKAEVSFLKDLLEFFNQFNRLENLHEKLLLWIDQCKKNYNFLSFEKTFKKVGLKNFGEELISIFKEISLKDFLADFQKRKSASISETELIIDQIKKYKNALNKPNKFSYRPNEVDYNGVYRDLIKGNRDKYYSHSKSEIAGKTEAIQEFIKYLESLEITKKKMTSITNHKISNTSLLPIEIFENTRGYLKKNAQQILTCYNNKAYDACSVLLRKITEILIIELYEKEEIEEKIQDEDGNYFMLKKLITSFQNEKKFKKLISRSVAESLPKIKKSGDRSAHNRKYNARKHDIDLLRDDYRIVFEEFINSIYS